MIAPLRKRHLTIWILLALVLPIGIWLAQQAVPTSPVGFWQQVPHPSLPIVVATEDHPEWLIEVRSEEDQSAYQLEINLKKPITVPALQVYIAGAKPEVAGATLIGQLNNRGTYRFDLPKDRLPSEAHPLLLYNPIHQQIINTLTFNR